MTAYALRCGLGYGPKTLRVTRAFANARGLPCSLVKTGSTNSTLSITRALVPVSAQSVTLTYTSGSSVTHGSLVTITGSGFGASMPAFAFAGGAQGPIENTTIGQIPADTLGGTNPGSAATNTADAPASTSNSWSWKRFSQRLIAANDGSRGKVVGGTYTGFSSNPDVAMEYKFGANIANGAKLYTSFWTRVACSPGNSGQHKILRLCGGTDSNISDSPTNIVYTNQAFNGSVLCLANTANSIGTNQEVWYGSTNSAWDSGGSVWQRTEIFFQMSSSAGARDGKIFIRNFTGGSVPTSANPTDANSSSYLMNSQWMSNPSNGDGLMRSFIWENYVGNSWTDATLFQDDYFVNCSNWTRAELWNSSTASSATIREIQEPTSWSDTAVIVRINKGGLSAGSYTLVIVDGPTDTVLASKPLTVS